MIRTALRVLIGLVGVLALLIALRLWIDPAAPAAQLGLTGNGLLGQATLRADVAGFFGAAGLLSLLAAWLGQARLLTAPLLLITLALTGRLITVVVSGYAPEMLQPMVIEAVLLVILLAGRRVLSRA